MSEIVNWCKRTFGVDNERWYYNKFETIYFAQEQDYAWFLLKWG